MGTRWVPLRRHAAKIDEILQVLWSDFYGTALFGDCGEIASLPHKGCRLEVIRAVESAQRQVNLLLPGQVLCYKGSFCFLDRFKLPSEITVGLWHLVGFKLRLVSDTPRRCRARMRFRTGREAVSTERFVRDRMSARRRQDGWVWTHLCGLPHRLRGVEPATDQSSGDGGIS